MCYGVKIKVWGDYACFTRPEFKTERVSYDVITPSAARGLLGAIYRKPAINWVIDKIHVINPVKFDNIRRNELKSAVSLANVKKAMNGNPVQLYTDANADRSQRATLLLRDVCYVIEAHFDMTSKAGERDSADKHYAIVMQRLKSGRCYYQPFLGCREFSARFELIEDNIPVSKNVGVTDLGYMLYDLDYDKDMSAIYFRVRMENGVIDVTKCLRESGLK